MEHPNMYSSNLEDTTNNPENPNVNHVLHEGQSQHNVAYPPSFKNIHVDMLNDGLVKNTIITAGSNLCIKIFIKIVNVILAKYLMFGLGQALMANYTTRRTVKKIRIGNRMLKYKSGGNLRIAMVAAVNWLLNLFTLGLWTFFGGAHKFYYRQLDQRIYWGNPAKVSKKKTKKADAFKDYVLWVPEDDCLGKIKFFSVYFGFWRQVAMFLLEVCVVCTLGIMSPFSDYYYYSNLYKRMELGKGRFCVIHPEMIGSINKTAKKKKIPLVFPQERYESCYPVFGQEVSHHHNLFELKLKFNASFSQVACVHLSLKLLSAMTCGMVAKCCMKKAIISFYNRAAKVDLILLPQDNVPLTDVAIV